MDSAINHIVQTSLYFFRVCEGIDIRIVSSACQWYRL